MSDVTHGRWGVVLPIRPPALARPMLAPGPEMARTVADAMAKDAIDCVARTGDLSRSVVVTAAPSLSAYARSQGLATIEDRPLMTYDAWQRAVQKGLSWVGSRGGDGPVVVMPADLGDLDAEALDLTLQGLPVATCGFVPDRSGTKATIFFGPTSSMLRAELIGGSASFVRRHRPHLASPASARHDVDCWDDLRNLQRPSPRVHGAVAATTA